MLVLPLLRDEGWVHLCELKAGGKSRLGYPKFYWACVLRDCLGSGTTCRPYGMKLVVTWHRKSESVPTALREKLVAIFSARDWLDVLVALALVSLVTSDVMMY